MSACLRRNREFFADSDFLRLEHVINLQRHEIGSGALVSREGGSAIISRRECMSTRPGRCRPCVYSRCVLEDDCCKPMLASLSPLTMPHGSDVLTVSAQVWCPLAAPFERCARTAFEPMRTSVVRKSKCLVRVVFQPSRSLGESFTHSCYKWLITTCMCA